MENERQQHKPRPAVVSSGRSSDVSQWKLSPQAHEPVAMGLSIVKPLLLHRVL